MTGTDLNSNIPDQPEVYSEFSFSENSKNVITNCISPSEKQYTGPRKVENYGFRALEKNGNRDWCFTMKWNSR